MTRPDLSAVPQFYKGYVEHVKDFDVLEALKKSRIALQQLVMEMKNLRVTTIDLFSSFTPAMLLRTGEANKVELSVLNLGYIIAGHESHHRKVITERYLN